MDWFLTSGTRAKLEGFVWSHQSMMFFDKRACIFCHALSKHLIKPIISQFFFCVTSSLLDSIVNILIPSSISKLS